MWKRYWGLNQDPFLDRNTCYVPLPGHQEAVARLVHTIEAGGRLAVLSAAAGLGKTLVLEQALIEARAPGRRFALVTSPGDGVSLFAGLAQRLGIRVGNAPSRAASWRALEQGVRICALQGFQVVLAADESLGSPGGSEDLERLIHLGENGRGLVTVLWVVRDGPSEEDPPHRLWTLLVRLQPLSRSEVERYLTAKLAWAGGTDSIFTPRAVTRLQARSRGNPRGVARLASLCLMAGAARGMEAISAEVVDAVAGECRHPEPSSLCR